MLSWKFRRTQVKNLLKIPEQFTVVALIAVGYARNRVDASGSIVKAVRGKKKLEYTVSAEECGAR